MNTIFATTTRGLEAIGAAEMAEIDGMQVEQTRYRRIHAHIDGSLSPLLNLRTIDDVFLTVATWEGIPPQRSSG
jgi:23S rRNA G2445 N2-methylase RlmL